MTKFHHVPFLLVVLSSASAQLLSPATPDQLLDYANWLGPLNPADQNIVPSLQIPASTPIYEYGIREWTTWEPIDSPFLPGFWEDCVSVQTEIVFIGQTGDNWGRFGYSIPGHTELLSESASDRQFGSNVTTVFYTPANLDFLVESTDGRPYDEAFPTARWYYGKRQPISSVHDEFPEERLDTMNPYYVFALEISPADSTATPSLFVFGVNTFDQDNRPIPEPATYGLLAVGTLLALIARRRSCARRYTGVRSCP